MIFVKGSFKLTQFILLGVFALTVLSFSSAFAVTDYLFFSINGDTSLTTTTQGDFVGWGSNCDVGTSVYFEIWYDVNSNGTIDQGTDVIFEAFNITDGVVVPDEIISDNNPVADGFVQTESFPIVLEAGQFIFKGVNTSDQSSAQRVLTVNVMPSPPNQVNGNIIVPGHPAPDALLSNIWMVGDSETGIFISLTDINGNYSFNIGPDGTDQYLYIEPGNIDGFVTPDDQEIFVSGVMNNVDFTYFTPVDSVYGFIKDVADQIVQTVAWVECSYQYGGSYKDSQTDNGRFVINFTDGELGAWRIGVGFDNLIPDYIIPDEFNFSHDTIGSFQHDIIVTRTDTVFYVRVTEDGGLPSNNYLVDGFSNLLSSRTMGVSGTGTDNIIILHISSLDNSGWEASISTWDDDFPIPPGFLAGSPVTNISPGDTVTLNLSSSGSVVSGILTVQPGDDLPFDWTEAHISLSDTLGNNYSNQANSDGSFDITCPNGSYYMGAYLDGYLAYPSGRIVEVTGDTTGNLGFEFNKVHARITGSLVNIPTPVTGTDLGVYAYTGFGGFDGYNVWSEIDYVNGTYTMYLCDGDFNVNPPMINGFLPPTPIFMAIADPPDTLRIHDFVYTSLGCCVGMRGNIDNLGGEPGIDISDVLFMVEYMFRLPGMAPEPPCMDEADVNGSGLVDISDILYMVEYMFRPPGVAPAPVMCP